MIQRQGQHDQVGVFRRCRSKQKKKDYSGDKTPFILEHQKHNSLRNTLQPRNAPKSEKHELQMQIDQFFLCCANIWSQARLKRQFMLNEEAKKFKLYVRHFITQILAPFLVKSSFCRYTRNKQRSTASLHLFQLKTKRSCVHRCDH